jgi:hypothetical protein
MSPPYLTLTGQPIRECRNDSVLDDHRGVKTRFEVGLEREDIPEPEAQEPVRQHVQAATRLAFAVGDWHTGRNQAELVQGPEVLGDAMALDSTAPLDGLEIGRPMREGRQQAEVRCRLPQLLGQHGPSLVEEAPQWR